jgi:long-chain acyl-CoA synthetase
VPKLLDAIAAERPDDEALVDEYGRTTWGELHERTRRLINALGDAGVGPGDTIAMMLGNRRECFEVFQACAHLGTTYVPVNWHWVADELAYVLEDSGATVLLVDVRFVDVARAALADPRSAGVAHTIVVGDTASGAVVDGAIAYEEALSAAATDDLADDAQWLGGPMFYTSGTTGRPKGVRGALSGSTEIPSEIMSLIASGMSAYVPQAGRSLLVGPVYHSAQWAFTFMPMVNGSAVVMRHKFDPAETVRLIGDEAITNIHLVPTQFKRMLDVPEAQRAELDTTSLVACWHGAAPCPPASCCRRCCPSRAGCWSAGCRFITATRRRFCPPRASCSVRSARVANRGRCALLRPTGRDTVTSWARPAPASRLCCTTC